MSQQVGKGWPTGPYHDHIDDVLSKGFPNLQPCVQALLNHVDDRKVVRLNYGGTKE